MTATATATPGLDRRWTGSAAPDVMVVRERWLPSGTCVLVSRGPLGPAFVVGDGDRFADPVVEQARRLAVYDAVQHVRDGLRSIDARSAEERVMADLLRPTVPALVDPYPA